jgi:hypothetical protein
VKVVVALMPEVAPLALTVWAPLAPALVPEGMWPPQVKLSSVPTVAVQISTVAGAVKPVLYLTVTVSPAETMSGRALPPLRRELRARVTRGCRRRGLRSCHRGGSGTHSARGVVAQTFP